MIQQFEIGDVVAHIILEDVGYVIGYNSNTCEYLVGYQNGDCYFISTNLLALELIEEI